MDVAYLWGWMHATGRGSGAWERVWDAAGRGFGAWKRKEGEGKEMEAEMRKEEDEQHMDESDSWLLIYGVGCCWKRIGCKKRK